MRKRKHLANASGVSKPRRSLFNLARSAATSPAKCYPSSASLVRQLSPRASPPRAKLPMPSKKKPLVNVANDSKPMPTIRANRVTMTSIHVHPSPPAAAWLIYSKHTLPRELAQHLYSALFRTRSNSHRRRRRGIRLGLSINLCRRQWDRCPWLVGSQMGGGRGINRIRCCNREWEWKRGRM